MKLDLNNPWVLKLIRNSSTENGCSFIRGVIFHYLWVTITRTFIGIVAGWILFSILGGAYMYFFGDNFFAGGDATLNYFGESNWQRVMALSLALGGFLWPFAGAVAVVIGVIYLLVKGLGKLTRRGGPLSKLSTSLPSLPQPLVEAVVAWHEKFCPKLEFVLPLHAQGYVAGARVLQQSWNAETEEEEYVKGGTVTAVEVSGRTLRMWILWDSEKKYVDDHIDKTVTDETPEEKEAARQQLYNSFTREQRYWLDQHDSDWEEIKLAPVEEVSSPQ